MRNKTLPAGWEFLPSDESVGIFGEAYVHEACGAEEFATEQGVFTRVLGTGANRQRRLDIKLSCPCGASVVVTEVQWDPDFEEVQS